MYRGINASVSSQNFSPRVLHAGGEVVGGLTDTANMVQRSRIPPHPRHFSFYKSHRFCLVLPSFSLPEISSFSKLRFSLPLVEKYGVLGNIVKNNRRNIRSFKFSFFFLLATVEKSQFGLREKIFSSFSVILEGKKNDKKKKKRKEDVEEGGK